MKAKTLIQYIPEFLSQMGGSSLSRATITARERHLLQFKKWLTYEKKDNISPENLSKEIVEKYEIFLKRERNLSESTVESYLRSLRFFLQFLEKKEIKSLSPQEMVNENPETDLQKLINYYFQTKGISPEKLKKDAKKKKIIYSRYTKPAKDLLDLADSPEEAKKAIKIVADWAKSRNLDYALETVLKKWFELDNLHPKKKEKKPYYKGDRMVKSRGKWYVIDDEGEWFEFAGDKEDIDWKQED